MTTDYKKIKIENHFGGEVVRVILNSPRGNVLDGVMMGEINDALKKTGKRPEVKIVVFEGEGKHFCFGASVEEHRKEKAPEMLRLFHDMFYQMIDNSIPCAALVRGMCLGGGMELAIYCDFVFAQKGAVFGQPEIKLGVLPPPASIILPLRAGQRVADEIILAGGSINAERAVELGVANFLIPEDNSGWEFVSQWIKENILPLSASSLRHARACERMFFHEKIKEILPRIHDHYLNKLMETRDANEGILSFIEKRKPDFKNE